MTAKVLTKPANPEEVLTGPDRFHVMCPSQVVVDAVDHNVLVAACESRVYDLTTATEAELLDIVMPLNFAVRACSAQHRLGCRRATSRRPAAQLGFVIALGEKLSCDRVTAGLQTAELTDLQSRSMPGSSIGLATPLIRALSACSRPCARAGRQLAKLASISTGLSAIATQAQERCRLTTPSSPVCHEGRVLCDSATDSCPKS